jgi:hypothetical protein
MKNIKYIAFRILSGILAILFFAMVPVIFMATDGWRKAGVIPVVGFGIIFLISLASQRFDFIKS